MNYYTLTQLQTIGGLTNPDRIAWHAGRLQKELTLLKPFIPGLAVYYQVYHEDNGPHVDGAVLAFEKEGFLFRTYYGKKDGLKIYPVTSNLPNISRYDEDRAKRELAEPNAVRKLSQKKVDEYIRYKLDCIRNLQDISRENTLKVDLFRKKIAGWNDIKWSDDNNTRGSVTRNGLVYEFSITDGEISTEVKIYWENRYSVTPEDFAAMADNRLIMKKK